MALLGVKKRKISPNSIPDMLMWGLKTYLEFGNKECLPNSKIYVNMDTNQILTLHYNKCHINK